MKLWHSVQCLEKLFEDSERSCRRRIGAEERNSKGRWSRGEFTFFYLPLPHSLDARQLPTHRLLRSHVAVAWGAGKGCPTAERVGTSSISRSACTLLSPSAQAIIARWWRRSISDGSGAATTQRETKLSLLVPEGCGVPIFIFLASLPTSWLWMQVPLWESCSGAG